MVEFIKSRKFDKVKTQYIAVDQGTVVLRVSESGDHHVLMTATTGDTDIGLSSYPDQDKLVTTAYDVLSKITEYATIEKDRYNRPFVKVAITRDKEGVDELYRIADIILERLGIDTKWVEAARQEMSDLWDALAIDDDSPVYLSDGMYLTKDGRIQEGL